MELSALARKQKRCKDWLDFVEQGGVQDPKMRTEVLTQLDAFRKYLAKCWEAKVITPQDEGKIVDLERRLEQLNEESRMTTVGKKGGLPARIV
jgi:hypothetical protein